MAVRLGLGAIVALSTAIVPTAASSAVVDESTIELSIDGTTWNTTPPDALFPVDFRIVPGDEVSSTLYIRSARDAPSELTVVVSNVVVDNSHYREDLLLSARDDHATGMSRQRLSSISSCIEVIPSRRVARGEVVPVTLSVELPMESGNQTQHALAQFWIQVGLSEDTLGGRDPFGCPTGPIVVPALPTPTDPSTSPQPASPGVTQPTTGTAVANDTGARAIATTGSDLLYPALALAGSAIGAGLFLLRARRTQRDNE